MGAFFAMSWLRSLAYRFQSLLNKQHIDEELDEELRFCLQMETDANIRRGMSTEEARRAARLKLGGAESTKAACRDERGFPFLEPLLQDLHHGARKLAQAPTFSLIVVSTLSLGIGANVTILSIINGLYLNPLPYRDPRQLVDIASTNRQGGIARAGASFRDVEDWSAQAGSSRRWPSTARECQPNQWRDALAHYGLSLVGHPLLDPRGSSLSGQRICLPGYPPRLRTGRRVGPRLLAAAIRSR